MKVVIVSHTFPPDVNGQAIMLGRILGGMALDEVDLLHSIQPNPASPSLSPMRYVGVENKWLSYGQNKGLTIAFELYIARQARRIVDAIRQKHDDANSIVGLVTCTGYLPDWPAAMLAAHRLKIPLIPYAFDCFGHQFKAMVGPRANAHRLIAAKYEPLVAKAAKRVIVPNEYLADYYRETYGVEAAIVRNPIGPEFYETDVESHDTINKIGETPQVGLDLLPTDQKVRIVYTGNIYNAQWDAVENLLSACRLLGERRAEFVAYTSLTAAENAQLTKLGPLHLMPPVSACEVAKVQRAADILFLPLAFHSGFPEVIRTSAPGKLGEYLASGRPILVHAPADSFVCWYMKEWQCGWVVDELSPEALATTVKQILQNPEEVARRVARGRECAARDFAVETARDAFRIAVGLTASQTQAIH